MTEGALAQKKCTPCRGGVAPLDSDEVQSSLPQVTGWSAVDGDTKIAGEFRFKNFRQTLDFVTAVGELAESEFHHPVSINFGWGFCTIVLQTKKIRGLARERLHHGGEDQRNRCRHERRRMRSGAKRASASIEFRSDRCNPKIRESM